MNQSNEEHSHAGIQILWPILENEAFKEALAVANDGGNANNISPIIKYGLEGSATTLWLGDLETDFMTSIEDEVQLPEKVDILFAPHHGRKSGRVPTVWLKAIDPGVIVVGEAPSKDLEYYAGYNTITQNTAGDIVFDCVEGAVHVYVSSDSYSVNFLKDKGMPNGDGYYIGTLDV